jgi:hypothetical protein
MFEFLKKKPEAEKQMTAEILNQITTLKNKVNRLEGALESLVNYLDSFRLSTEPVQVQDILEAFNSYLKD